MNLSFEITQPRCIPSFVINISSAITPVPWKRKDEKRNNIIKKLSAFDMTISPLLAEAPVPVSARGQSSD